MGISPLHKNLYYLSSGSFPWPEAVCLTLLGTTASLTMGYLASYRITLLELVKPLVLTSGVTPEAAI